MAVLFPFQIAQLFYTGRRYLTMENFMEFSIYVLAILSVLEVYSCLNNYGLKLVSEFVFHLVFSSGNIIFD